MNWYIWSQYSDPSGEIEWLESQLRYSELMNEKVFIIAHIPPQSSDCLHSWSERFRGLTERFQHIIRLQLYGHSHDERWHMHRGWEDGTPIGIEFCSASLGTRGGKNAGFRVYELDAETMVPIEVHRYSFNLTKANIEGYPDW